MLITKKIVSIVCIYAVLVVSIQAQSVFILVHGTWGADAAWYMPKGDFFEALEETVSKKNSAVVPFRWSGGCGHEARIKAAQTLTKLIKTYDPKVAIYIIGHSHGGNVATLASHMLAEDKENKHHIRALFTLGTPIMSNYLPNMGTIHYLYNLFSFEDLIQTVLGISLREYPEHKRIANLRVFIDGKEPHHAGLHHPFIGKWLPYLHLHFKQHLQDLGITDHISEPSIVYFSHEAAPRYEFDVNRSELLDRDRQISMMILDSLRNSLEMRAVEIAGEPIEEVSAETP
jgi:pimeloyl-ACP methyl ester carboxylesterase